MSPASSDEVRAGSPSSGEHERHLAVSTLVQQISQVVVMLAMLGAITVLARQLSLSEFGTYGLLVSLTTFLLFVQASIEPAAIKAIAEATDQPARDRAFSTALSLYIAAGFVAGVLIAAVGSVLLRVIHITPALHDQAQISVLTVGIATCVGWPMKIFQDVLRGSQHFATSSIAETIGFCAQAALLAGLALYGAPLWMLVTAGASSPFAVGTASSVFVYVRRLPYHYRRERVTLGSTIGFVRLSGYLVVVGIADLVIYSVDRAILAVFRSAASVGLYEGPIRAHNLIRQLHGTLVIPVLPATARYLSERDERRTKDLLLRGTRYTLAAVVPPTLVLMILAKPILLVWLGPRYTAAATAMTILVAYWLINGITGVAWAMLVAAGQIRRLTVYTGAVAAANLALSLALTPAFGINGVVLGTSLSYALGFPFFMAIVLATFPVTIRDFAREAWIPAYATGLVVGAGLLAVRLSMELDELGEVVAAGLAALVVYWAIYYVVWLRQNERVLVKNVARALVGR